MAQFKELPQVKKWIDQGESVGKVDLTNKDTTLTRRAGLEGSSDRANDHVEAFSQAALAEEKVRASRGA